MDDEFNIYFGGAIEKRGISGTKHTAVTKTEPEKILIPDKISECALYLEKNGVKTSDNTCLSKSTVDKVTANLHTTDITEAKKHLNCTSDRCVLQKMESVLGIDTVQKESLLYLKVQGPTDVQLLSNVNIDTTMKQWSMMYSNFYPYHFHMRNFTSFSYRDGNVYNTPDTLATLSFTDLYNSDRGYKCTGCIINTDVYQGPGEHWMALFADSRGNDWTVEFFNSSGNGPAPEWVNWLEKTKVCMESLDSSKKVSIVKASSFRHQQSRTECGLYSLFYIWARLNGVPVEYFARNHIPDQLMFEFRQHLFDDPHRPMMKKFNWDEYVANTRIKWE